MNMKWKELSTPIKITTIISYIICVIGVIGIYWNRTGTNPLNFDIYYPALCLFSICEIIIEWGNRRIFAYIAIASAIIFGAISVVQFVN